MNERKYQKQEAGMTPCQTLLKQEGTARRIESMQQSSATPKTEDVGRRLRKIVACSQFSLQCLLVSTVFGTVPSLHPTSFIMIFTLVPLIFSAISKGWHRAKNCLNKKALRGGLRACNNLPQPPPYILVFGGCGRLLHALKPPRSAFLFQQFLTRCHLYILLHF